MSDPDSQQAGAPRVQRGVLFLVFMTILIDFIGFSVLIPVLPQFAKRLGAGPREIPALLYLYALAQLVFLPAWGYVSDRIGRRPVLLVSLGGTAVSFTLLASADNLTTVYVSRILAGFFAASIGTAQAVVTDVTGHAERARGMGAIGAAFGLGMILGPPLGGVLGHWGEKYPFYAVAGLALANLALAIVRLPETAPKHAQGWSGLAATLMPVPLRLLGTVHDRQIGLYLYFFFHLFSAFAILEAMITFYLSERFGATKLDVAWIFACIGLVLSLTQGVLLRYLVPRLGEVRLLLAGLVLMAGGLFAVALAPSLSWYFAIGAVIALGNGITFPSFSSLYSKVCVAHRAGEFQAQSQSMATTGRIVGPALAGWVMTSPTDGTPFVIAGAMMLGALMLFSIFRRTLIDGVA
jgi:multidrug resistance protein